jgi:Methyltransferase domain
LLAASLARIEAIAGEDQLVLDVGGWASPLARADWVIDLMPYETRGLYGKAAPDAERFSADTWVQADVCDREPWPFADGQFDFSVCSQTLEDLRDPVWVCSELTRVSRAGYVETPSRLEEQAVGLHGNWAGWTHHRWLVEHEGDELVFVHKPHMLSARPELCLTRGQWESLTPEQRVVSVFWEGTLPASERVFTVPEELDAYLAAAVDVVPKAGRRRRQR